MKENESTIRLENLIKSYKVSYTDVAKGMDLQYRGFRKKLLAPKSIKISEAEMIADILGCSVRRVLKCITVI